MNNYYIPSNKRDLIKWIKGKRPDYKLSTMKNKQLYAIFYKLKREGETDA